MESFDRYKSFTDTMNDGARILNVNLGYRIPFLESTQEEYEKYSKVILKYAPMINSYNNMVSSAGKVDLSNQDSIKCFYVQTAIFSLELTLIATSVYSGPAYGAVGAIYRASELQFIALKCSSCVSTLLSHMHWFVRNTFVQGTVSVVSITLTEIEKLAGKSSVP